LIAAKEEAELASRSKSEFLAERALATAASVGV
jgi:hypothetical protein